MGRAFQAGGILIIVMLTASKPLPARGQTFVGDLCLDFANFRDLNEWSPVRKCHRENANIPNGQEANSQQGLARASRYRRGPSRAPVWQQDNQWRILLFPASNGSAWVYHPAINSWIRLHHQVHPPARYYHTMTTLCNTSIILFGGIHKGAVFNDTWLFDGETDTWQEQDVKLWTENQFVPGRFMHMAVAVRQPLSNCKCQESILVYGGILHSRCHNDLWEMRCIADTNGRQQFYWIPQKKKENAVWPQPRYNLNAADFNKNAMFVWGGVACNTFECVPGGDVWIYSLTSGMWEHVTVETRLPASTSPSTGSFFDQNVDGIVITTIKYGYVLKYLNGSLQFDFRNLNAYAKKDSGIYTIVSVINVGHDTLLVGTSTHADLVFEVLNGKHVPESAEVWNFLPIEKPETSPAQGTTPVFSGHFLGTSFYVASVTWKSDIRQYQSYVWQFDLVKKVWFQIFSPFGPLLNFPTTSSTINDSMIVWYCPDPSSTPLAVRERVHVNSTALWVFHTAIRRWTLCLEVSHQHELPPPRHNSTMVEMENGSLLMFGGKTDRGVVNELWRVDVCEQKEYVPVRENCVRWVLLSRNSSSSIYPSPRHSHAAFMANGSLFVFGGISETIHFDSMSSSGLKQTVTHNFVNAISPALSDMWQFQIDRRLWKEVIQEGSIPILPCIPYWRLVHWETKVVVATKNSDVIDSPKYCERNVWNHTITFDLITSTWSVQADAPRIIPDVLTFWKGLLVVVGWSEDRNIHNRDETQSSLLYTTRFSFINPACPPGHYTTIWGNESCKRCPDTSYAALGARHCSSCPEGLTTTNGMRSSYSNCVCRTDYCDGGQCFVSERLDRGRTAVCQCSVGYTGTTCRYPTYFLVGGSAMGVLFLVFLLVLFVKKMMKYRRRKEDVEEELTSAHRVWTIQCDEMRLEERIDGDTPGSYGEVYRAIYRDMTVAVKHLNAIMLTDQTIRKEFEREVEVMRAIRHPNIVMFFGAGTVEEEINGEKVSYPFLVVELMARGTLKKILDSTHIHLSYRDKVAFALDAARGMQYLHSLSPPRIHRDMKSANLLISHSWVIKVADFGSARVVRREGERQPTDVSRSFNQSVRDDVPILSADLFLTRDTGTILWRAPEIFALDCYGSSADVYSFGIVLWELLCRKDPYKDHEFAWIEDVARAVQSGIRPTIPPSSPTLYVNLTKECWNTDPERRPKFTHIVERLVAMADVTIVQSDCEGEATTRV